METPEVAAGESAPKQIDLAKLKEGAAEQRKKLVAEKKGVRTTKKQHAPILKEPPRGQQRGQIVARPAEWIECSTCTRLFSTKENPVRYGIRPRHAAKHLSDHRMGRIKRPKTTAATEHRDFHRREKKKSRTQAKRAAALARARS